MKHRLLVLLVALSSLGLTACIGSAEGASTKQLRFHASQCGKALVEELNAQKKGYQLVDVSEEHLDPAALSDTEYNGVVNAWVDAQRMAFECQSDITGKVSVDVNANPSGQLHESRQEDDGEEGDLGIFYHNSVEWKFLETATTITPGVRMTNATNTGGCSVGFVVSAGSKSYILTAGHCGDVGDQFTIGGQYVGTMVESHNQKIGRIEDGEDIGLIEISRPDLIEEALPMRDATLQGWMTPQEAEERGYHICHLGATTGYSCGVFAGHGRESIFFSRGIYDRGDSGGPVFALHEGKAWALGVVSRVSDYNKTRGGHSAVAPAMNRWGLELNG